eukprot:s1160_g12.t1
MVSAGGAHTVLLQSDGRAVSAGGCHTVFLRSDGRAVARGLNDYRQCDISPLDVDVTYTQVSAGGCHIVLLRSDGRAVAGGLNDNRQRAIPSLKSWWQCLKLWRQLLHFSSPSLLYISDLKPPGSKPDRVLQLSFNREAEAEAIILTCLGWDRLEVLRLRASGADLAAEVSRQLALQAAEQQLRMVLPDGQLLEAVCAADPFVTLATLCDPSPDGVVAHVPGSRQVELIGPTFGTPERHRVSSSLASSSVRERSDVHELWEEMEKMENMETEDLIACEGQGQDGVAPPPPVTPKPPPSRSSRESAGAGPSTLETSQERHQERLPTHEEALAKVISALSSRKSSVRYSRKSSGNSPTSRARNSRNSVDRSGSKEKVTFEDREDREEKGPNKASLKNGLASSKSRVDEFKDFVKPRQRSSAQKFVWNFLEDPDLVRGGRSYGNILFFAIIISAVLPIVPTPIEQDWFLLAFLYGLLSLDCLFFLEVVFRFYGAPHRARFFGSIHNWVDILSVLVPVALKIRLQSLNLAADAHPDVEGVELGLIVMVPVIRLLKLLRRFENSHLIKQAFREAVGALPSLLYCMMVLVVGFSAIIYVLEPRGNVETMPRAIWFTMVTLTTVGYGDVVPVSPGGNIVVCVLMIVSAMYMAMPLGIVGKAFGSVWDDRHRLLLMQRLRTRFSTVGYDPQDIPGLFCSYDENGDGELSMEEFRQMLQQLEVEAMDERAHDVFAAFDNDGSGAIDDSEMKARNCSW